MHHAVDPAQPVRLLQLAVDDVIAQIFGDVGALLDDAAVHVDDVERAVGRVGEPHRPEALVRGGEELPFLVGLPCPQSPSVILDHDPADQVGGRIDDEHVAVQLRGQTVAAVDLRPADRREAVERAIGAIDAELIRAVGARIGPHRPDDVDLVGFVAQGFVAAAGTDECRVAQKIRRRHVVHVHRRLVGVPVDPPGVVLGDAPLATGQRLAHLELAVLEPQIGIRVGGVHPVVHRPVEVVGVLLDARLAAAVELGDLLLGVHLQIAVRVLHQPGIRRLADQDPVIEHLERTRQDEAVGEDRALVHHAVPVGVLEHDDLADGLHEGLGGREIRHEAGHFHDPDAALPVPVHHDRVLHQRLAGDELDAVARRHVEGLQRVGRTQRRRLG